MKTAKITIEKALLLRNAIHSISEIDQSTRKAKFALPIRFSWACSRTATKIKEALEPLQEKINEIWGDWEQSVKAELLKKIKDSKGKAKETAREEFRKEIETRNDKWSALAKEEIEVEIFTLPKLRENEVAQLDQAGFTPNDLEIFIDLMDLSLEEAV